MIRRVCLLLLCTNIGIPLPTGGATAAGQEKPPVLEERLPRPRPRSPASRARLLRFKQQYEPRFRRIVTTELLFIREVAQPNREEFAEISAAGDAVLDVVIGRYTVHQLRRRLADDAVLPSDPRPLISKGLADVVNRLLPAEQAARYDEQLALREEARRRVAVISILAKLDRHLILSAEQREQFRQILDENYHQTWSNSHVLSQGNRHFPRLPANDLLPLLNATQRAGWPSVYKRGRVYFEIEDGLVQDLEIDVAEDAAVHDGDAADE